MFIDSSHKTTPDRPPWTFTCKVCGGQSLTVTRVWSILAGPDSQRWQEWGPLAPDHFWHYEYSEKIEPDTAQDSNPQRGDFGDFTKDDSDSEPEDFETFESQDDPDADEFYVNCADCDREIEFGWSRPVRGGRIFPAECSDFVPRAYWPEPRYAELLAEKRLAPHRRAPNMSYLGRKLDLSASVIKGIRDPIIPIHSNSRPLPVWVLIILQLLLGLGAVFGGGAFILAPDGHLIQMPLDKLDNSPFSDFLVPGLLLFFFVGVFPLTVAYGLWKRPTWPWPNRLNPFKHTHWSWAGSLAAGVAVIVWIIVQLQFIPIGFLHVLYLAWGFVILVITLLPSVRRHYTLPA